MHDDTWIHAWRKGCWTIQSSQECHAQKNTSSIKLQSLATFNQPSLIFGQYHHVSSTVSSQITTQKFSLTIWNWNKSFKKYQTVMAYIYKMFFSHKRILRVKSFTKNKLSSHVSLSSWSSSFPNFTTMRTQQNRARPQQIHLAAKILKAGAPWKAFFASLGLASS